MKLIIFNFKIRIEYILILMFLFQISSCKKNKSLDNEIVVKSNNQDTLFLNNKHDSDISALDSKLIFVFKNIMDSNDHIIYIRPEIGIEELYYSLKFFKTNNNLYFTVWAGWFFPEFQYYQDNYYSIDTNNIYYYKLFGRNTLVIDFPESNGYVFYKKERSRNQLALKKKREHRLLMEKYSPRIDGPKTYRKTYKVIYYYGQTYFVPLKNVIDPPPYKSEENSFWTFTDLTDK